MSVLEFNRAYASSLSHQRLLLGDANMLPPHGEGRLITDYSMTQRSTGDRLDRLEAFDRHAMYLLVCFEVETRTDQ